jgi:nucleoside recognition membrane protein YjiH
MDRQEEAFSTKLESHQVNKGALARHIGAKCEEIIDALKEEIVFYQETKENHRIKKLEDELSIFSHKLETAEKKINECIALQNKFIDQLIALNSRVSPRFL